MLVVVESFDTAAARSLRNLPLVQLIKASELNAYDVLCNDWIVFSESTLPTATAADDVAAPERAVHATDPAEGARDEATDEPQVAEHPAEPAEGTDDTELEPPEAAAAAAEEVSQGTDGSVRAAASEEPGTAEGSASDEAESSGPQASETDETAVASGNGESTEDEE